MNIAYQKYFSELRSQVTSKSLDVQAAFAEFVGMILFITISCGTAVGLSSLAGRSQDDTPNYDGNYDKAIHTVGTAMAFGFTIAALAYATAHTSGGQFNPAVSVGVFLAGKLSLLQCAVNVVVQVIGAIVGAAIVDAVQPYGGDGVGANALPDGILASQAFLAEIVGTFTLVFVVLETACNRRSVANRMLAPLAIGVTVFVDHLFLIPYTSASINPARSLGPAIVSSTWDDMWVYTIGPLLGGIAAMPVHLLMTEPFEVVEMYQPTTHEADALEGHSNMVDGTRVKDGPRV